MSLVGTRLSHYDILEELGAGGMGVVYKARDANLLRQVAIKTLSAERVDDKQKQRFIQEARAASALNHPCIVAIHDFGREGDTDFIVMEYVKGKSLGDKLSLGALPVREALAYAIQIAGAMAAAHKAGIIHRDLKPHNVMVTKEGGVKILDFGIAKLNPVADFEGQGADVQTALTGAGLVIGTLAYMSPEQAVGEKVDARSDIFSFGTMMYEMLAGKLPFEGDGEQSMLRKLHFETPDSLAEMRRDVPEALNKIVQKALSKHPDHRQQTMGYIKEELESLSIEAKVDRPLQSNITTKPMVPDKPEVLEDESRGETPMVQVESGSGKRREATLSRVFMTLAEKPKRSLFGALTLILTLGVVTGFVLLGVFGGDTEDEAPIVGNLLTVLPTESIGDNQDLAKTAPHLTESLTIGLSHSSTFEELSIVPAAEVRQAKVKTPAEATQEFNSGLVLASTLRQKDANVRMDVSLVNQGAQVAATSCEAPAGKPEALEREALLKTVGMIRRYLESQEESAASPKEKDARELVKEGQRYLRDFINRPDKKEHVDKAIESFQLAISKEPENAMAHAGLSRGYWRKYHANQDKMWLTKAMGAARRAVELNPELAAARVSLGSVLILQGGEDEALTEFEAAIQLDPFSHDALEGLAKVHREKEEYSKAEKYFRKAIQINPEDRELLDLLGNLYYRTADYKRAEETYLQSLKIAPDNVLGHESLGVVLLMVGEHERAANHLQRALEIQPTEQAYSNLGLLYFYQGRYVESVAAYEKVVGMPGGANDFVSWLNLGDAYRWAPGNEKKANNAFSVAIRLLRERMKGNENDPMLNGILALCLSKRGEHEQAIEIIELFRDKQVQNPQIMYFFSIACELSGKRTEALSWLRRAVDGGYSPKDVDQDPELEKLRQDPAFHRMMLEFEETRERPAA